MRKVVDPAGQKSTDPDPHPCIPVHVFFVLTGIRNKCSLKGVGRLIVIEQAEQSGFPSVSRFQWQKFSSGTLASLQSKTEHYFEVYKLPHLLISCCHETFLDINKLPILLYKKCLFNETKTWMLTSMNNQRQYRPCKERPCSGCAPSWPWSSSLPAAWCRRGEGWSRTAPPPPPRQRRATVR